jgi:hypothetical protein
LADVLQGADMGLSRRLTPNDVAPATFDARFAPMTSFGLARDCPYFSAYFSAISPERKERPCGDVSEAFWTFFTTSGMNALLPTGFCGPVPVVSEKRFLIAVRKREDE